MLRWWCFMSDRSCHWWSGWSWSRSKPCERPWWSSATWEGQRLPFCMLRRICKDFVRILVWGTIWLPEHTCAQLVTCQILNNFEAEANDNQTVGSEVGLCFYGTRLELSQNISLNDVLNTQWLLCLIDGGGCICKVCCHCWWNQGLYHFHDFSSMPWEFFKYFS